MEEQVLSTFTYSTVGIPEAGKSIDLTRVRPKDLAIFLWKEDNKRFKKADNLVIDRLRTPIGQIVRVGGSGRY